LVTKSLARRSGDHRYDLHELIRQFLVERFSKYPDEQTEIQARHSAYYLDYFTQADARLRRSAQRETLADLTAEMDNFRAAWDWALAQHEFERALQVSPTLWYLFELRAWFEEGETVFGNAAKHSSSAISDKLRAHSAYFAFRRGNTVAAYEALTLIAQRLSADENTHAQLYLGIVSREMGKIAEANQVLRESLEKAKESDDKWTQSMAGQFLGIIALDMGEYAAAHRYLTAALAVAREMGDPMLTAHALSFLSLTIQIQGETDTAEKLLQESLALTQKIGYRWGVGHALDGLGILAQARDPREARDLFAASSNVYREIGDLQSMARALSHQGFASLVLDDLPDAQKSFTEALDLARQCDYIPFVLGALSGFASLSAKRGNMEQALELALIVLNHPATLQETKDRAEKLRAEANAQPTRLQIHAAQTHPGKMELETVIKNLLAENKT